MDYAQQITTWLLADKERLNALEIAADLNLNDWCLAAGFVRNLIWDQLHNHPVATPLNDIDLIYFDCDNLSPDKDRDYQQQLCSLSPLPWSVKNQARMHTRNNDNAYTSTTDAMSYWVEVETAIGVRLNTKDQVELLAPFGLEPLFNFSITANPKRLKLREFQSRVTQKKWLSLWPKLTIHR